jgi:C-methyltransferase-like protein/putative zinc binding protein/methyltransferase family protein
MHSKVVRRCRICGNPQLSPVLSLGDQCLTGVFPKSQDHIVHRAPLDLVRCDGGDKACGLVQLAHSVDTKELYGPTYGYRSGLNSSMVQHLENFATEAMRAADLESDDIILDIGSNDGTLLSKFPGNCIRIGIDPLIAKFKAFYQPGIIAISEFFSALALRQNLLGRRAKLVTSVAIFYDLEDPLAFVSDIAEILADNGIWIFEQSYLPAMLDATAYDTICHEHLEYYSLRQVQWLLEKAGLFVANVSFNEANGGSFRVTAAKKNTRVNGFPVEAAVKRENLAALDKAETFSNFAARVARHRVELRDLIRALVQDRKIVFGYGASTKGNVILQYCGLDKELIPCIAEINSDKFGSYTPGTYIPIISEAEARRQCPDYYLVLPWHFRDNFLLKRSNTGTPSRMIFPLPSIKII